jgi:DeoR family transcriptional regulator, fructose operon transcriptional repressor
MLEFVHSSGISSHNSEHRDFGDPFPVIMIRMIVEERRQKLADIVRQRGFVPLPELVDEMGVSESTVRRDLDYLHDAGLLRRTHGGALAISGGPALSAFDERSQSQAIEKRQIGQTMASLIQDGETVLLDGGTTTLEVARHLLGRSLQVVTNSLPIAQLFSGSRDVDLVLIGGYVYPKTGVALGVLAQEAMKNLHVHRTVLSVSGLTARGLFNENLLLVETERAMMACSDETNVVADHTKFGRSALTFLSDWSAITRVVVDSGLRPEQRALVGTQVEVMTADVFGSANNSEGNSQA